MTLEEELKHIDAEIRKLKIQFDLYFVGTNPRPPNDQRDALEKQIKKYSNVHMKNVADRFLYNSLVNKFNAFSELWNKGLRAKEEGARVHPLAVRHAHQMAASEHGGAAGPGAHAGAGHKAGRGQRGKHAAEPVWRIPTGHQDDKAIRVLYNEFIAAKEKVGDAKKPTFDAFAREIARHASALKGRADCQAIDFRIHSADNKVSLKAKPSK